MKRKIFLTSVLVTSLIRSASAESFPTDGYMQENKTYENAATYTNIGTYEGEVRAIAEYTTNVYRVQAGNYLPAGSDGEPEPCPADSFCTGVPDAEYDEDTHQGVEKCPDEYPNSAPGATAKTQCYTSCSLTDVAHATEVSGNQYYGGANTCVATGCENGYHQSENIKIVNTTSVIPVDYTKAGDGYAYIDADGTASNNNLADAGLDGNNTWATHFEYGIVYGRASCQSAANPGYEYFMNNMDAVMGGEMTYEAFETGLAAIVGTGKAAYMADSLRDYVAAIETGDDKAQAAFDEALLIVLATEPDADYATDSTGGYCYCQMTGYTPTDGTIENATTSWVLVDDYGSADFCKSGCASLCANSLNSENGFRAAMFGARDAETAVTCDANTLTIQWASASEEDININNAGICTYNGDIRTPAAAQAIPGKTFVGWKFVKVE